MDGSVVLTIVLSGLCFLASCSTRFYVYVETPTSWAAAQSYCRSKYSDLATVHTEKELAQLNQLIGGDSMVWIALRPDPEAWRWSLENQNYSGAAEVNFSMWAAGTPSGGLNYYDACVTMLRTGEWSDLPCYYLLYFVCYDGTQKPSSSFIIVTQPKTWADAQQYCRDHYTDLATVRNQAQNDQIRTITIFTYTWIGLYRDSWKWVDETPLSLSNWVPGLAPTAIATDTCVASSFGKWINLNCVAQYNFACFAAPAIKQQLVQVVLKKTDPSVDMEQLNQDILQKFDQRLRDQGLNEDVSLRWVEQPDGNIFIMKKET